MVCAKAQNIEIIDFTLILLVLHHVVEGGSSLVFPSSDGRVRTDVPRGYWEIVENLRLKKTDVKFHTLAHTHAKRLAQAGVDMQSLRQFKVHSSIVT